MKMLKSAIVLILSVSFGLSGCVVKKSTENRVELSESQINMLNSQNVSDVIKKANNGDVDAQNNLGVRHRLGNGVPKSDEKAVYWYRKAAEAGDDTGMHNLGHSYHYGLGVQQDYVQAKYWYEKAIAKSNFHRSALNLGTLYEEGNGVVKNYDKAMELYRISALSGNPKAFANLGDLYFSGEVEKDEYLAYVYSAIVAKMGNQSAGAGSRIHARAVLNLECGRDRLDLAQKVANSWREGDSLPDNKIKNQKLNCNAYIITDKPLK